MTSNKFVFQCSHCKVNSSFTFLNSVLWQKFNYIMKRCDTCEGVIFFIYEQTGKSHFIITADSSPEFFLRNYKMIDYYPKRPYEAHEAIPSEVAEDYNEALRCFDNNAFKATVIMARKAIQTTCKIKGAAKSNLIDQIDEIMPNDMKELAHAIRIWGNLGAHPDELIKDVKEQDAKDILDLAESLFNYLFIMPYDVRQRLKKANKSPKP